MLNVKKLRDEDGHWYWVPKSMVNEFMRDLNRISGIDYMDDPDGFDLFSSKYEIYATGGDENNMPEPFEELR